MRSPILFLFLSLFLAGCEQHQPSASSPQEQGSPAVEVAAVQQQIEEDSADFAAKVQSDPSRTVHVFAPASGRLISLRVKQGDRVTTGEVLATLQSPDAASARSDFAKAKAAYLRSSRGADRSKLLYDHEALSAKEYEDARAQADADHSELLRAGQRLKQLGLAEDSSSDELVLRSPITGVVLETSAAPGEFSKSLDNANPVLTIADLSRVWVVGDIYEKDLAQMKTGTPAVIETAAYPGEKWQGKVESLSASLDPTSRTLKFRVPLNNPGFRLKPEMFAQIKVALGKRPRIMVPAKAIIHESESTFVMLRVNGKYSRRMVRTGRTTSQQVEVLEGLQPGEQIVTAGAELLREGNMN